MENGDAFTHFIHSIAMQRIIIQMIKQRLQENWSRPISILLPCRGHRLSYNALYHENSISIDGFIWTKELTEIARRNKLMPKRFDLSTRPTK